MKLYKSIRFLSICLLVFCSCTNVNDLMSKGAHTFLLAHVPGHQNIIVDSITKPFWTTSANGAKANFSFCTQDGFTGQGNIDVVFDDTREKIVSYYLPSIRLNPHQEVKSYTVKDNKEEEAFGYTKRMITVIIPEQYNERELEMISKYLCYTDGYFSDHLNISYYLEKMSLNGPNYAFVNVHSSPYNISTEVSINILTAILQDVDLTTETQKANDNCPFKNCKVLGTWQFIGASTITIYVKNGSYYMTTYAEGKYLPSDKLIKIQGDGYPSFKYEEDTGEYFSIHSDGLYGYAFGDLACVYNNM